MAGGKETPRQKMIGMMYLVLTALLALNVSKAILDAFVAIEENIQISNENEYYRGEEKKSVLTEKAQDKTAPDVQKKAKKYLTIVDQIDKMTAERIKEIDDLKLEILKECGEDITAPGPKERIIYKAYDPQEPLKPTRMKLEWVQGKDKYDEPMRIMIGAETDIKRPSGKGNDMYENYLKYRNQLCELLASSSSEPGKKYSFKSPDIRAYNDEQDKAALIKKSIEAQKIAPDDKDVIAKIFGSLTKLERSNMGEEKDVHWVGKTFDHSPSVAAIASLSSLQKEILTARADAVALIQSRVGGGEYSFNKILPLAYGPEVANQNEEVEIQVLMAAFDSDKQPIVTVSGGTLRETKEGKGFVTAKGSSGELNLSGNITIMNKSGVPKTMPWEKKILIMKPQGTVSLPEMNVLYRGYANKIEAVASGYPDVKVNGVGVSLSKSANGYIGTCSGGAKEATISISGFNKVTNKSVPLGSFKFRVRNLPPPSLFFGGVEDGGTASRAETRIFAKYGPEIPLAVNFVVLSWELIVAGAPMTAKGTGAQLDAKGVALLKQAKPGSTITIQTSVKGPDGVTRKKSGSFRV
jgi:hypothetical protein